MSDETKTKLEGDDAITREMANACRLAIGRAPYESDEWAKWPEERYPATVLLAWVRANLVAPAVAEAKKRGMELSQETINVLQADRDKLRAWADEWNSKACALQHQLNRANDSLAAEKGRSENLAKGLREANRLCTDYVGEIRELRAKVSALEAHTCKGSGEEWREVLFPNVAWNDMASWAQMVCNLAAEQMAVPKLVLESCRMRSWAHMSRRLRDRIRATFTKLRAEHGEMLIQTASEEYHRGLAAKLVVPAPAALPKVGETVEVYSEELLGFTPARVVSLWPSGRGFDCSSSGLLWPMNSVDEGKTWRRVQPQPSESARDVRKRHGMGDVPQAEQAEAQARNVDEAAPVEPPCVVHGVDIIEVVGTWLRRHPRDLETDKMWALRNLAIDAVNATMAAKAPSEPQPEDVATPALDGMKIWNPGWQTNDVFFSSEDHKNEVYAAYRRDLAAAFARETERLRKENEDLRRNFRTAYAMNEENRAKLIETRAENDDLRRQLREHVGECAVCGSALHDRSSFPLKGVRVCGDCAQQSQSKLEAAIDARRAGK